MPSFTNVKALGLFDHLSLKSEDFEAEHHRPVIKVTGMPGKHVPPGPLAVANDLLGAVPPTNGWMHELGHQDAEDAEIQTGCRIYISRDTLLVNELKDIPKWLQEKRIDLMLIHLGGTTIPGPSMPLIMVTMDAKQGIEMIEMMNPDVTIPIHCDDYDVFLSPRSDFEKAVKGFVLPPWSNKQDTFKMTRFRPCIDLHAGQVKQIVGGTLDSTSAALQTNYVSQHPPAHFAQLYRDNELTGAHVIMLGPGNDGPAKEALQAWSGGLQVGGGINDKNAKEWMDAGAEKVIITSYLFPEGRFSQERLDAVLQALGGDKNKLVIDLSCRRRGEDSWFVAMNKWQTLTDMEVNQESIRSLEPYCSEFLIHAADNEGLQKGVDEKLVERLSQWCSIPVTYAGGGRHLEDLENVKKLSNGKVDLTIGSALDCFGGSGVKFDDCVAWNRKQDN
ncbi:hypothetical protein KAF25_007282 [Fusarium avenaceum]|uniref:1-(5-phosphoribosyl)-5-[(5-phosphoribosylamino)methylideneamino] imidazole-4-carboxamide isomerase n=1 Tax=Fusarium avenaceum TaxID=40199 RepID=A0A9P7GYY7_9HYPO|nr:hypothetical protein KAF25_007282 [Fusarium avenaceum]